jgi:hypothetical protein
MEEEANRLRDYGYREEQIARAARKGERLTHQQLIRMAEDFRRGAAEMRRGADEMRRSATTMR